MTDNNPKPQRAHRQKHELFVSPEQRTRYEMMCKLRFDQGKTLQEIANEFNLSRERVRQILNKGKVHKEYKSSVYNGWVWELFIHKTLLSQEIENRMMPYKHPYDIKTKNGARIDVKSNDTGKDECNFDINRENKINYIDFFVIVIVKRMDVFIIPYKILEGNSNIYISYKHIDKWLPYKDAYDLIKKFKPTKIERILEREQP
jgi:hypothetical protein